MGPIWPWNSCSNSRDQPGAYLDDLPFVHHDLITRTPAIAAFQRAFHTRNRKVVEQVELDATEQAVLSLMVLIRIILFI